MTAWTFDPLVIASLLAAAAVYGRGAARMRRPVGRARALAFAGALLALTVALLSPVEVAAGEVLWAHMLQHVLLISAAAPLLAASRPGVPLLVGLPGGLRRALVWWGRRRPLRAAWRILTAPAAAWLLAAVILWTWHVPALYEAAVGIRAVHVLEHLTLLGSAWLFWRVALPPTSDRRLARGMDVVYLITGGFQGGALGALFVFSAVPFYELYASSATPLADQQLAGALMWIPSGVISLGAAAALFVAWLREEAADADSPDRPVHRLQEVTR